MKIQLSLLLLIVLTQGARVTQDLVSEVGFGIWTTLIEAKSEHSNIPAQYFLCGFEFLEEKWSKQLPVCKCGWRFYRWRLGWRCNQCWMQFFNRASGFNGIFCHANNWGDQVVKTFSTGSPNSRNWKGRVMCPIHTYATAFNGKYGGQHDEILGFHGLLLSCLNHQWKGLQDVQDNQMHLGTYFPAKLGSYISSFKLKYEIHGRLTGFAAYTEPMSIISNVSIEYNLDTGFQNYPITFGTEKIQNCGQNPIQKKVGFIKNYETIGQWNSDNPQAKGYPIMRNITLPPPRLLNTQDTSDSSYKFSTNSFDFDSSIKTTMTTNQEVMASVAVGTQIRISTIMQQQKGIIPYKAVLTLISRVTGEPIMGYRISGVWQGVTTSSVETKVLEVKADCEETKRTQADGGGENGDTGNKRQLR